VDKLVSECEWASLCGVKLMGRCGGTGNSRVEFECFPGDLNLKNFRNLESYDD
jgi:hypothetical protein